jgi:adenylate cyclase
MDRKLAAILAADVVGYSALMERDEAGTHERLTAGRKELFEPEITRHHGRVFQLMGDGLLAEFTSAIDAVACAVALQRGLAERNQSMPEDHRFSVRIGINLGEVIIEGDDRYGETVNIAARLQQLAEPGGVCVSGKVAKEVEKKLAFGFEPMGEQRVKNIAEPIAIFRVNMHGQKIAGGRLLSKRAARRPWLLAGLATAALAAVAVLTTLLLPFTPAKVTGPPSLAILPFANASGDSGQDYLGLGIADDLATMLSTSPAIRVVSEQSSFASDTPAKAQEAAEELGVDYVVQGSVRRSQGKMRISAQLIDGHSGDNLWKDKFDEEGNDIGALQEAIAGRIYASLGGIMGEFRRLQETKAWSKSGPGLEEYDYHLRGVAAYLGPSQRGNEEARRIWREGLAKFPASALLRLEVAATYSRDVMDERTNDPWTAVQIGWQLTKEAEAIPNKSRLEQWLSHYLLAVFLPLAEGNFERAAEEAEAAHSLVPYDPYSNADLSFVMANAGRADRAVAWAEFAVRTEARVPDWYRDRLAWAYYNAGRPADALAEYGKISNFCRPCRIAALVRLGRLQEARELAQEHMKLAPHFTIARESTWPGGHHPQMIERLLKPYLADLAKAELPVGATSHSAPADLQQPSSLETVRLWTLFTGQGKCLDIINDGENNKPIMAVCGNYTGQFWTMTPTEQAGRVRLRNAFSVSVWGVLESDESFVIHWPLK